MGKIICYVREDGKVVLRDEDSREGWIVSDVIMEDTELAADSEPQVTVDEWKTDPDDIDIDIDDQDPDWK